MSAQMACEHRWQDCWVSIQCRVNDDLLPDVAKCRCGQVFYLDKYEVAAATARLDGHLVVARATAMKAAA